MEPVTSQILKQNPSMLLAEFILLETKPEISPNLIIENLKQLKEIQLNQWPLIDHKAQILGIDSSPPPQDLGLLARGWRNLNRKLWSAFDPAFVEKVLKSALTVLSNAYSNPQEVGGYEPEATEIDELIRPALEGVHRMMKTYSEEGKAATSYTLNMLYHVYLQKVIFLARQRSLMCVSQSPAIPIHGTSSSSISQGSPLNTSYVSLEPPINAIALLNPAPPLPNLDSLLKLKMFRNREILLEKLKPLFLSNLPLLKSSLNLTNPIHLRRSQIQSSLPLEIDSQGKVYAILKQNPHAPPLKRGSYKKIFGALNLEDKTIAAWAKIVIPKSMAVSIKIMLMNETQIQRHFNVPQIVRILHQVTYQNKKGEEVFGIMLEFCDANLDEYLNDICSIQDESQSQKNLWHIFEDILIALTVLEQSNVHHRDLKPANIMLVNSDQGWRAKIADFGFATTIEDEMKTPLFCGSPMYMAPEFIAGYSLVMFGWNLLRPTKENKIMSPFTYEELTKNNQNVISYAAEQMQNDVIKKFAIPLDKLNDKDRIEFAKAISRIGIQIGASLKGDIWAAGLILFRMRIGVDDRTIFRNSECLKTHDKFCNAVLRIAPKDIDQSFSSSIAKGSLEELNRRMLNINPNLRPDAKECLEIIRRLRSSGAKFN